MKENLNDKVCEKCGSKDISSQIIQEGITESDALCIFLAPIKTPSIYQYKCNNKNCGYEGKFVIPLKR